MKLKDLYDLESQQARVLTALAKVATSPELVETFAAHAKETEGQLNRLEASFAHLDMKPAKSKLGGPRAMIADNLNAVEGVAGDDALRDAMLASASRSLEHVEIASYLSAIDESEMLGERFVSTMLKETLLEEITMDKGLSEFTRSIFRDFPVAERNEEKPTHPWASRFEERLAARR